MYTNMHVVIIILLLCINLVQRQGLILVRVVEGNLEYRCVYKNNYYACIFVHLESCWYLGIMLDSDILK